MDKDWVTVMNQWGNVSGVKPAQVNVRRMSKNAVTNDSRGNPIRSGDQIEIADNRNAHNGKRATVLHVFRSLLFCHSREMLEHGGVFVTRASSTISTKHGFMNGGGRGSFGTQPFGGQANTLGAPAGTTVSFSPRVRKHALTDRSTRIVKGAYKGYMASIMDVNPPKVRLKLHTNNKIVNCNVKEVQNPDDVSKTLGDDMSAIPGSSSMYRSTPNPFAPRDSSKINNPSGFGDPFGGRTPSYSGSRTPAYGGRTPGYSQGDSNRTPAWQAGSRTPGYGDGGRTPAWDAGSKTPGYLRDGDGARTPAPAWDTGSTPRIYNDDDDNRAGGRSTYGGGADRSSGSRFESQL